MKPAGFVAALAVILVASTSCHAANTAADSACWDRAQVYIDTDGNGFRDTPFFPVGIYGHKTLVTDANKFDSLAATGINCVYMGGYGLYNETAVWDGLDKCAENGIRVILLPYNHWMGLEWYNYKGLCGSCSIQVDSASFRTFFSDTAVKWVDSLLTHPENVIGWYLDDEPDLYRVGCPCGCDTSKTDTLACDGWVRYHPDTLKWFYDIIAEEDPGRTVFTAVANNCGTGLPQRTCSDSGDCDSVISVLREFSGCTDVIYNDEYEFRNCSWYHNYWTMGLQCRECGKCSDTRDKPYVGIIQAFGPCSTWTREGLNDCSETIYVKPDQGEPERAEGQQVFVYYWPEYVDLRNMTYSTIIQGGRGLMYWTYGHAVCSAPDTTTFNMISFLTDEILRGDSTANVPPISEIVTEWDPFPEVTCNYDGYDTCGCDKYGPGDPFAEATKYRRPQEDFDVMNYYPATDPDDPSRCILIAVNDCCDSLQNARFTFPAKVKSARVLAGRYPHGYDEDTTFTNEGNDIVDDFAPWQVHVYEVFLEST